MKLSGWLVVLAEIVALASGLPATIHIGGLFNDDELEIAFQIAVNWLNGDKSILTHSKVVAKVEKLYSEEIVKTTELNLSSMHVQSICDHLEVPYIESRLEHRLVRDLLSINLHPHPSVLSNAFVHLLDIWGWNEFFLVYEEDEAIIRMKDILVKGREKNWNIKIHQFKDHSRPSYRETFWGINESTKGNGKSTQISKQQFVLDVPLNHLYEVMKSAQQVGMMTENQKYLITSLDLHTIDLEDFQYVNTTITGLRLVQEHTPKFQEFLQEVNNRLTLQTNQLPLTTLKTETALIYDSVIVLAQALVQMDSAKNVSVFPAVSCIQMNKGVDGTSLMNFMKHVRIETSGLSGRIEFDNEGFRSVVSLDVMSSTHQGLTKIGTISFGNRVNFTSVESSEVKLKHSHLKVTTHLTAPFAMLRISSKVMKDNDRFEGYCVDLLRALAQKHHFTYEIRPVKDNKYGMFNRMTNSWDGMIGEVVRGEADIAIADITITSDRMRGVDFTMSFMQSGIGILFKKPSEKVFSLFSFLQPFSRDVWLLVIAAYIFVSLNIFLVGRMSPYEWRKPHPCKQNKQVEKNCFSLLNSMWFSISSIMQQGSDFAATAPSTRAITSIWYFFCLIMISSYTANLAAFLSVVKLVSPIESAEDLANQENIKYGCVAGGSTGAFFQRSTSSTYRKMHDFMQKHEKEVYVSSNAEGIKKVLEGHYAHFMESTSIEYIVERHCNLTQVGGLLAQKSFGIAVRKGHRELRSWLSEGILQLQEEGTLHALKEKWWKHRNDGDRCSDAHAFRAASELGLENVGGIFVVMLLGLCLSACVAIVELLWFQRRLHRDPDTSLLQLLMKQIRCAFSADRSILPALKMKDVGKKNDQEENLPGCSSYI